MISSELKLPERHFKPRTKGITILIDNGVPLNFFKDTVNGAADYIDFVKFGWGTSLITKYLEEKIDCLKQNDVQFFFGGTLFEKFLCQDKIEDYYRYCKTYGCQYVEISNGTIRLSNKEKASFISDFAKEFHVFSEVGSKDSAISNEQESSEWIDYILEDLEAGAEKVITETREGGTSGLCKSDGEMRSQLIEEILRSGIKPDDLIFEAPNKKMQTCFIEKIGPDVNMANIPFQDAIPLETLRLGLRSDTFYLFE
ncbi:MULTISPECIES: phosphosulfolactate synthase [Bacillus]|uniref:phosphosulfolactate synthase n=1 Tax=Bacillus TaxID=1386 RepID=UPI000413471D|nr:MULTISPECIES: phosphosulfolactate synthase [Bacillus]QHZ47177.1 phosphosulfolactate synthase [Bacillus sp. NSP9.1]WFA07247.1 phosphosulfolactate synthase [Bacillus sp. HSf4]